VCCSLSNEIAKVDAVEIRGFFSFGISFSGMLEARSSRWFRESLCYLKSCPSVLPKKKKKIECVSSDEMEYGILDWNGRIEVVVIS